MRAWLSLWLLLVACGPATADEVERWVAQLSDPDPLQRELAAIGLCELGPEAAPAVPVLRRVLREDPELAVRQAAVEALVGVGVAARPAAQELLDYTLGAPHDEGCALGWAALEVLEQPEWLASVLVDAAGKPRLQAGCLPEAVPALGVRCLPLVQAALTHADEAWRLAAAEAVCRFPRREVQDEEGAGEEDAGEEQADPPADDAPDMELDPELTEEQMEAFELALEQGGGGLTFGDERPEECAWELPELLVQGLAGLLLRGEDEADMAYEALAGLGVQGTRALDGVVAALSGPHADYACDLLATWSETAPEACAGLKPRLLGLLREPGTPARDLALVELLGPFPGEEVTAALLAALRHPSPDVRSAAADLLADREGPVLPLAQALVALLEREGLPPRGELDGSDPRSSASATLGYLAERDPQAVGEAAQAVRDPDLFALLGQLLADAAR